MGLGIFLLIFRFFLLPFLINARDALNKWRVFKRNAVLVSFMLPGAGLLLLLNYLPMPGIMLAFKQFVRARRGTIIDSIAGSKWVGLTNFAFIGSERAQAVLRNTFIYNFCWMILSLVLSVAIAIALNHVRKKRAVKFYQTSIFMPYFISWVIASYLLFALLSHERGVIRHIALALGIYDAETYPNYYLTPGVWPFILTVANQWKYMGYDSIVYTAAIAGIDAEMYEAAALDGAGVWERIRYITLPMLTPMMTILTIMAMGRMASADFGLFYNLPMNAGQLVSTTDVYDTYVFRMLTNTSASMGVSAAASLFQSVLGFVLIMLTNSLVKRLNPENTLF